MKIFSKIGILGFCLLTFGFASCGDDTEYDDANTENPSWADATHPESLEGTRYVRAAGMKVNVKGEEIQGFVESLNFVAADSVAVKMSQGTTEGTWIDESNNDRVPLYEYTYTDVTGRFDIIKRVVDDKKKVSKVTIFTGIAISGSQQVITIMHYGDTPAQTYLLKQ